MGPTWTIVILTCMLSGSDLVLGSGKAEEEDGTGRKIFDSLGGMALGKRSDLVDNLVRAAKRRLLAEMPKRNFDMLDGSTFGKRNFDVLGGSGFGKRDTFDVLTGSGFGKRSFDVLTGSGFGKRNFDVLGGSGFGKRSFDLLGGSGFGKRNSVGIPSLSMGWYNEGGRNLRSTPIVLIRRDGENVFDSLGGTSFGKRSVNVFDPLSGAGFGKRFQRPMWEQKKAACSGSAFNMLNGCTPIGKRGFPGQSTNIYLMHVLEGLLDKTADLQQRLALEKQIGR